MNWRDSIAEESFRDQFRHFDRGSKKYKGSIQPSIQELINFTNKENSSRSRKSRATHLKATAFQLVSHDRAATEAVQEQVADFCKSGTYGSIPREKPDDIIRVYFENFNSLSVFRTGKHRRK